MKNQKTCSSMNSRIMHFLPSLKAGGAEVFVTNLLIELARSGINVSLVIYRSPIDSRGNALVESLESNGVKVYMPKVSGKLSLFQYILGVRKALQDFQPDLVNVHLPSAVLVYVMVRISLFDFGSKAIETVHNTEFIAQFPSFLMRGFRFFFSGTVFCSRAVELRYPKFWRADLCALIKNGVPNFIERSELTRGSKTRFCVVGAFREDFPKGQDLIVSAVELLDPEERRMIEITFVGDGPTKQDIEMLIAQKALSDCFLIKGVVDDVSIELERSHCILMPSRYEGMPIALLEAMMYGRPSILSEIEAFAEFASISGVLTCSISPSSVADAISKFLKIPLEQLQRDCKQMQSHMALNYSISASALSYVEFYNKVRKDPHDFK